ncbi:hypothetical protein [Kitasatospora sp. NPDC101183]|uniref:hypothetical protein n=1 Tax=Kitasatospora sp. NPDC101183 TaxID=3364100 RepID=UPI003821A282
MSYELQALMGTLELLRVAAAEVPAARVVPLAQGLALIPLTPAVLTALHGEAVGRLAGGFELRLAAWSKAGPIARVAYVGGDARSAVVWSDGRILPDGGPSTPIARALRLLGARVEPGREGESALAGLTAWAGAGRVGTG